MSILFLFNSTSFHCLLQYKLNNPEWGADVNQKQSRICTYNLPTVYYILVIVELLWKKFYKWTTPSLPIFAAIASRLPSLGIIKKCYKVTIISWLIYKMNESNPISMYFVVHCTFCFHFISRLAAFLVKLTSKKIFSEPTQACLQFAIVK